MGEYPILRHGLWGQMRNIVASHISLDNHLMATISEDRGLVIWCLRTGQPLVSLINNESCDRPIGIALIPDISRGTSCGSWWLLIASEDEGLRCLRLDHFQADSSSNFCCDIRLLHAEVIAMIDDKGGCCKILAFDVCPSLARVGIGCSDKSVRLFNFADGSDCLPFCEARFSTEECKPSVVAFGHTGDVLAAASREGRGVWLWSKCRDGWQGAQLKLPHCQHRTALLKWSQKDSYLYIGLCSGTVFVFSRQRQLIASQSVCCSNN